MYRIDTYWFNIASGEQPMLRVAITWKNLDTTFGEMHPTNGIESYKSRISILDSCTRDISQWRAKTCLYII
jgi:hypothetical protein